MTLVFTSGDDRLSFLNKSVARLAEPSEAIRGVMPEVTLCLPCAAAIGMCCWEQTPPRKYEKESFKPFVKRTYNGHKSR